MTRIERAPARAGRRTWKHGHGKKGALGLLLALAVSGFSQPYVLEKTISTGPWVITSATSTRYYDLQPLGIAHDKIVAISGIVREDGGIWRPVMLLPPFKNGGGLPLHGGKVGVSHDDNSGKWQAYIDAGVFRTFYSTTYDDPNVNRAVITIRYLSDAKPDGMPQDNTHYIRHGGWDPNVMDQKYVTVPIIPADLAAVTDFATIIHSNPVNGKVDVDKYGRPAGNGTTNRRDRGGNEALLGRTSLHLYSHKLYSSPAHPDWPGIGRFNTPAYSGSSVNRGWSMVKYSGTPGTSTLSQPYAVLTSAIPMGGWKFQQNSGAGIPLNLTLSNYGIEADRVVNMQALNISDHIPLPFYNDFHTVPALGGGGGITISGIENKIIGNPNSRSSGSDDANNRGFITISHRAADCADGNGPILPLAANIGDLKVSASVWNGTGYSVNSAYAGCHGYNKGILVIENTGNNIWESADQFRFAYKPASGSRQLTVKVEQLENTNPWARAGLMIREGTAVNAKNAAVFVTPGNGIIFQARPGNGSTVSIAQVANVKAPVWLHLYYAQGSQSVYAAYSPDGTTFYTIGSHLGYGISFGNFNMGVAAAGRSGFANTSVYSNLRGFMGPVSGSYYKIINRNSGKALDVTGSSTANGAKVIQWGYAAGNNQIWQVFDLGNGNWRIMNKHSGKALEIGGMSTANGAAAQQWSYVGGLNQQWQIGEVGNDYFMIAAAHSGKVLDVSGASTADGASVVQNMGNNANSQQWQFLAP